MPYSGSELELEEAKRLHERAVSVGYTVAMIEQVSCDKFRVVVHGIPGPHERPRQGGCDSGVACSDRAGPERRRDRSVDAEHAKLAVGSRP